MTPWVLDRLAAEQCRERLLAAERERLAASARTPRARRDTAGRRAAMLGQLLAIRREAVVR